jgi:hypothetical protein
MSHHISKTLNPEGEVAVAVRPEGVIKIVHYTGSGAKSEAHSEFTMTGQEALKFATEILQQVYRLGEAGK